VMFDVVFLEDSFRFSLEMRSLITDDLMWHTVSTHDVFLNELGYLFGFQHSVGFGFDPLGEIVDCY